MSWLYYSRMSICAFGFFVASAAAAGQDGRLQDHHEAMLAYAQKAGKAKPVVKDYAYGEKLDIARMIGMTDALSSCELVPMAMTYEDRAGQLTTVLYSAMGTCPKS
ncbi:MULTISPECIES: DUF2790 domain-containing protein [Pseudomonas]|uniref:DUF2790 domain-containing protein n=1 Tax=Pseudomonas TaxID=286 RepID=UPI00224B7179|nr:DUF2790 domain-containing protein [Pseudomonas sp. DCB_BI]MCX2891185.1 DUF2790 domain-containing protein [Pseudomonas sp. DCB_BI]